MSLRPFRRSLVDVETGQQLGYRASAFWRWLVERYGRGDYGLLTAVLATPLPEPAQPDWIAWLDAGLAGSNWGVGKELAVVFPSFLASYATWGDPQSERWPHVGTGLWRDVAFDGCRRVALTEAAPTARLDLDLVPLSGACVEVLVEPSTLRGSSVQVRARSTAVDAAATALHGVPVPLVDDLHLAVAEFGGTRTTSEPNRCDRLERTMPTRLPACVVPAHTAHLVRSDGGELWGRVWSGEPRAAAPYTDVLVFSRAPAAPTDATIDPAEARRYTIEFALDGAVAVLAGAGAGEVIHGANFRTPGTHRMPMRPSETEGDGSPLDPSRLLFGQQAPGLEAMARTAGRPGLFFLQFMVAEVGSDDDGVGWSVGVVPEGGSIPYGATGTFRAALLGTDPTRLATPGGALEGVHAQAGFSELSSAIVDAGGEAGSTTITVLAWDDLGVRLDVRGRWCYGDELRPESGCTVERAFEASVWLAFGDAYDGAEPYESVDSPMQAIYRRVYGEGLVGAGGAPGMPSFAPEAQPTAPGAVGGAPGEADDGVPGDGSPECDCSCASLEAIDRMTRDLEPDELPPPEFFGQLQCLITCAPQFDVCRE